MASIIGNDEYITKYVTKSIDTRMVLDSASAILERGNKVIPLDFENSRTVKILDYGVGGMYNYTRVNQEDYPGSAGHMHYNGGDQPDGYKRGNFATRWEEFTLQWDRGVQIPIDFVTNKQMGDLAFGNTVEVFTDTQYIPELDTLRFSYLAGRASDALGNKVSEAIDSDTDLFTEFNKAFAKLTNFGVKEEDQVIFITPTILSYIRSSSQLTKFLNVRDIKERGISTEVQFYNNHPLIVVPEDRFYTNAVAGEGGVFAGEGSTSINFIIASPKFVTPVRFLQRTQLYGPEYAGLVGFDGYLFNFHNVHGIFVADNKVPSLYVSVASTLSDESKRTVFPVLATGSTQNGYVCTGYYTKPAGLIGALYFSAAAVNIGDNAPATKVTLNKEIVDATNTTGYFALVDLTTKKVIAVSKQTTLPKHS